MIIMEIIQTSSEKVLLIITYRYKLKNSIVSSFACETNKNHLYKTLLTDIFFNAASRRENFIHLTSYQNTKTTLSYLIVILLHMYSSQAQRNVLYRYTHFTGGERKAIRLKKEKKTALCLYQLTAAGRGGFVYL